MKKLSVVICVLILSAFLTGTVFAQKNVNAYFLLDNDLATVGYQGLVPVVNIGSSAKVGFAICAMQWEQSAGIKVRFEWDGTKANYVSAESGLKISSSAVTINGHATTLAAEDNIISNSLFSLGEASEAGVYENSYALLGGSPSTKAEGLIFFAVFTTSATFTAPENLTIGASVTVADAAGTELFLGTRYFNVSSTVVQPVTWKNVKEQFKDF